MPTDPTTGHETQERRGPNGGRMFLDRELCPRCDCCELVWQPCDVCGGDGEVEADSWEGWDEGDYEECDVCCGAGGWTICLGRCDEHGKHKPKSPGPIPA